MLSPTKEVYDIKDVSQIQPVGQTQSRTCSWREINQTQPCLSVDMVSIICPREQSVMVWMENVPHNLMTVPH